MLGFKVFKFLSFWLVVVMFLVVVVCVCLSFWLFGFWLLCFGLLVLTITAVWRHGKGFGGLPRFKT